MTSVDLGDNFVGDFADICITKFLFALHSGNVDRGTSDPDKRAQMESEDPYQPEQDYQFPLF